MSSIISKPLCITYGIISFKFGLSVNNAGFILASRKLTFKDSSIIKSNPKNSNSPYYPDFVITFSAALKIL